MRDRYKSVFGKPHQFSPGLGIATLPRLPRQRLELLLCARWRKLTVKDAHPAMLNATCRLNLHRQLVTDISVAFDVAKGNGSDADMRCERTLKSFRCRPPNNFFFAELPKQQLQIVPSCLVD